MDFESISHAWSVIPTSVKRLDGADWSMAINEGLIPADTDYISWSRGFRDDVPGPWWQKRFKKAPPG